MGPYRRCNYSEASGLQCEEWFELDDGKERLCKNHRDIISPNNVKESDELKVKYIDLVNTCRAEVYKMTLDEIDVHLAGLEKELENVKTRLFTTGAIKREKLDQLTEEERKELRKIKVTRAVNSETSNKSKAVTIKSNPIEYTMKKFNLTEAKAKELLGL